MGNVINITGGGKPEEEKTVTAGTSVIEVLPSSGKTMKKVNVNPTPTEEKTITAGTSATTVTPTSGKYIKKVTVNPTPSQSKTVTPGESSKTVSPDSGKLLSSVKVNGDSNLIASNIRSGTTIFGVTGTFEPLNLATLLGATKVAVDEFVVATEVEVLDKTTLSHSLGEIPMAFIISAERYTPTGVNYLVKQFSVRENGNSNLAKSAYVAENINSTNGYAGTYFTNTVAMTSTTVEANMRMKAGKKFTLITMA